jgi:DNA-binding Xre family transcriptional regulator
MPRTHLTEKFSTPKRPAPDYPKALILERCASQHITNDQMAAALGVSANTWSRRKSQHTELWPLGELLKACAFLGVDLDDLRAAIRYSV